MFQSLSFFFLLFLLSGCGVETSSSVSSNTGTVIDTTTNPSTTPDTGTDSGTSDTNSTTSSDDNTTSVVDSNDTTTQPDVEVPDTAFDYVDAIEDPNACSTIGYRVVSDASYDGASSSENGASGFIVADQGLVLRSEWMSQDNASTWVTLFYKGFPSVEDLNNQGVTSYKMEDVFYLSYDIAWSDESIEGITRTMYLQSKKDEIPDCYRLELNSTIGSRIGVQKVYRVRK